MRVTVLIENTSDSLSYLTEHGLSLLVETMGNTFLVDSGAGEAFMSNAAEMDISLTGIKTAVASHNHTDHTGGFEKLLEVNKDVKLYFRKHELGEYFVKAAFLKLQISESPSFFARHEERIVFAEDKHRLFDNVFLCSVTNPDPEHLTTVKNMYKKVKKFEKDTYDHEQYVVVLEDDKMHIISACTHAGIINVLEDARQKFANYQLYSFFGGLHLKKSGMYSLNCSMTHLNKLLVKLKESGLVRLYTGHCTGKRAFDFIQMQMGDNLQYLGTGKTFEV